MEKLAGMTPLLIVKEYTTEPVTSAARLIFATVTMAVQDPTHS